MGMAAGQARLLSITSRMSDNELRAQIINNQKMRLATESSQVSEAYVNALNQAQMMFTNYDADNNASYQQLTFNSLTSYNPYNNQYGLVNASGQLLVSEKDAKNYMNADGDMDKFLAYYGLEKTTTYFDELTKATKSKIVGEDGITSLWTPNGNVPVMSTGDNGSVIYVDSGYTPEQLEIMFNGGTDDKGVTHSGYDKALNSSIYINYTAYAEKFDSAFTSYAKSISENMLNVLNGLEDDNGNNLSKISSTLSSLTPNEEDGSLSDGNKATLNNCITGIDKIIEKASAYATTGNTYFSDLREEIEGLKKGESTATLGNSEISWDSDTNTLSFDDIKLQKNSTGTYDVILLKDEDTDEDESESETDTDTNTEIEVTTDIQLPGDTKNLLLYIVTDADGNTTAQTTAPTEAGANYTCYNFATSINELCKSPVPETAEINCTTKLTGKEQIDKLENIISELKTAILNEWDTNNEAFILINDGAQESPEHLAYRYAAAQFIVSLLNSGTDTNSYTVGEMVAEKKINDTDTDDGKGNFKYIEIKKGSDTYYINLDQILLMATDQDSLSKFILEGLEYYTQLPATTPAETNITFNKEKMQDLIDVIALNNVMNTYGEPKVTWIDTSSPTDSYNENGEAKYAWYSNLFTRMQKGFAVLQDGLASSNEWIQFALENGIVTMEQVDSEDNWNGLNYANCSDITEQTNDKAVALAEAEYNAAMNKIENKDKRYDLELKNIDTEHNSLQTEYDSIKTAIDKNIERTFKIYS